MCETRPLFDTDAYSIYIFTSYGGLSVCSSSSHLSQETNHA